MCCITPRKPALWGHALAHIRQAEGSPGQYVIMRQNAHSKERVCCCGLGIPRGPWPSSRAQSPHRSGLHSIPSQGTKAHKLQGTVEKSEERRIYKTDIDSRQRKLTYGYQRETEG